MYKRKLSKKSYRYLFFVKKNFRNTKEIQVLAIYSQYVFIHNMKKLFTKTI